MKKFLTNAAQAAAEAFLVKCKPLYIGLALQEQLPGKLEVMPIDGQHITCAYKPSDAVWLDAVFNGVFAGHVYAVGYANDGQNEGVLVTWNQEGAWYNGAAQPHITLSTAKGAQAVDTGLLHFTTIEDFSKGWKSRLGSSTIEWKGPGNRALPVTPTAYYGNGESTPIGEIRKICSEYIRQHYPDEAEAQLLQDAVNVKKSEIYQLEEKLKHAKWQLEQYSKDLEEVIKEANTPQLWKDAEKYFRDNIQNEYHEHIFCINEDDSNEDYVSFHCIICCGDDFSGSYTRETGWVED